MKLKALDVEPRKGSLYPEPFASRMKKKIKRQLGDQFGIKKYGVNLTILEPGGESALLHHHRKQEEFVYILSGNPTLITSEGEYEMAPGDCVGFIPEGPAHQLVNRTNELVQFLEVGDRDPQDEVTYPNDDLVAKRGEGNTWIITRKNGEPY